MSEATATVTPETASGTVDRYVAVWNEPDPTARRSAIGGLWAPDGAEFVHEKQFRGHEELAARVTAYEAFVASGKYAVTSAGDVTCHDDIVMFTASCGPLTARLTGKRAYSSCLAQATSSARTIS